MCWIQVSIQWNLSIVVTLGTMLRGCYTELSDQLSIIVLALGVGWRGEVTVITGSTITPKLLFCLLDPFQGHRLSV